MRKVQITSVRGDSLISFQRMSWTTGTLEYTGLRLLDKMKFLRLPIKMKVKLILRDIHVNFQELIKRI